MRTRNIFLLIFVALMAIACTTNEKFNKSDLKTNSFKNVRVEVDNFIWSNGPTRSSVDVDDEGVKFKWRADDTIGIFPSNGFQVAFPMASGAGTNSAEFDGGDWKLRESALYVAYYPFNFYNKSGKNIPVTYIGQVQDGNGSTAHIGKYDYLSASAKTPENGAVTFNFNHLGALLQIKLKVSEPVGLTSLTLETEQPHFVRRGSINLMDGYPEISCEEKFQRLSMELSNITTTTADEEVTLYMIVAPANLSGKKLNIYLSTANGNLLSYEMDGKNLEAGKAYSFSSSDGELEEPHLEIADSKGMAIGSEGGVLSLKYLSNLDCEYIVEENTGYWIESLDTKSVTKRTGQFSVKENLSTANRRTKIIVKGKESNLALEYTIVQGGKGSYAITKEGGLLPVGILYTSHPPVDSNHGVDKMADNNLYTYFEVEAQNFSIMWEGAGSVGISSVEYGLSANRSEIHSMRVYTSEDGIDWGNWRVGFGHTPYAHEPEYHISTLPFMRATHFRFNIHENFGAPTTMVPEFRFSADTRMDGEIKNFQDLLDKGDGFSNSTQTPMGRHYENRHVTTDEDKVWLLDPENEPALLSSASGYNYREYEVNLYPYGTPQPADVNQRGIGDCCAMAVFAEFAYMFPDFIKSIITDHNDGTYTVKMYDPQGKPVEVRVKSTFLGDNDGLGATAGKDGKANWATIMEKAIMKWNFIYQANPDISGIGTEQVVPLFTGNGDSFAIYPNQLLADNLDRAVDVALENNMVVVGGFNKDGLSVGGPTTHTFHAYSFMYSTDPEAMFAVRNPWGHNDGEPKGADGVMHVMDDGVVPPTIDVRIVYPGAAEPYAVTNLGPYIPPQYQTNMLYNHAKGVLERVE